MDAPREALRAGDGRRARDVLALARTLAEPDAMIPGPQPRLTRHSRRPKMAPTPRDWTITIIEAPDAGGERWARVLHRLIQAGQAVEEAHAE